MRVVRARWYHRNITVRAYRDDSLSAILRISLLFRRIRSTIFPRPVTIEILASVICFYKPFPLSPAFVFLGSVGARRDMLRRVSQRRVHSQYIYFCSNLILHTSGGNVQTLE